MIFALIIAVVALTVATVVIDVARTRAFTPLVLLSLSNFGYIALNPIVWIISRREAEYFEFMIDLGGLPTESGMVRLLLCAALFQTGCLALVLFTPIDKRNAGRLTLSPLAVEAIKNAGIALNALGLLGILAIGFRYDGTPIGLYHLAYGERTEYLYRLGPLWLMSELPYYGCSLLIIAGAADRRRRLLMIVSLAAMIVHGLALKAKLPILYAGCAYAMSTALLSRGGLRLRHAAPLAIVGIILLSLGQARHARQQDIPGMVEYLTENVDEWEERLGRPWSNDLPGPAALSYLVSNDEREGFSIEPLRETVLVFVPRFVWDRGPLQGDVYAKTLLRNEYFEGAGLAWSLICDGYRLLRLPGVFLIGLFCGFLAHEINRRAHDIKGRFREHATVLLCVTTPIFLAAGRGGLSSLLKTLFIVALVSITPLYVTFLRAKLRAAHAHRNAIVH